MRFFIKLGTDNDTPEEPETPDTPPTETTPLHRGAATEIEEIHQYIYAGGKLLRETISDGTTTKTLDFTYDNVGMPYSLIYNNGTTTTTYYYITNLQGDVMYLVDANGVQVAAYDYDPYGKVISSTGELTEINPLRYRGYYYDSDTGYYYLKSRYYNPQIGRFINADGYASTGQGFLGYNMFAYCLNNPILCADEGGNAANPRYNVSLICDGFFKQPSTASSSVENSAPAGSFFGAEASYTFQQKYERELAPQFVNMVISCKSGTSTSTILASSGDSSRPLSVYAQGRADNEILSSAGLKINIANFTLNVSIGADNLGVSASIADHGTIKSIALTADISQFKIGGEFATTVWDSATSEKIYTNISVSGWLFVAAYIYYRTGEWYSTPTSTFG